MLTATASNDSSNTGPGLPLALHRLHPVVLDFLDRMTIVLSPRRHHGVFAPNAQVEDATVLKETETGARRGTGADSVPAGVRGSVLLPEWHRDWA